LPASPRLIVGALVVGALALGGFAVFLIADLRREPAAGSPGVDAAVVARPAPGKVAAAPAPAPSAIKPATEAPRAPNDGGRLDVATVRIAGQDVQFLLDPMSRPDDRGTFVTISPGDYTPEERATVRKLVEVMIAGMQRPPPPGALANAFPPAQAAALQRIIKGTVFIWVDGKPAVWFPQVAPPAIKSTKF
jgi:hypothetical protein